MNRRNGRRRKKMAKWCDPLIKRLVYRLPLFNFQCVYTKGANKLFQNMVPIFAILEERLPLSHCVVSRLQTDDGAVRLSLCSLISTCLPPFRAVLSKYFQYSLYFLTAVIMKFINADIGISILLNSNRSRVINNAAGSVVVFSGSVSCSSSNN